MKARCLVFDSDAEHASALAELAGEAGFAVDVHHELPGPQAIDFSACDLVLLDLPDEQMDAATNLLDRGSRAGVEFFVMSAVDTPEIADRAIRLGASYYFCKPVIADNLRPLLRDIVAECASERGKVEDDGACTVDQFGLLRGNSRSMRKLYRQIRKVAHSDMSVLVFGESGTGKELVAHTTHLMSERRDGPYVAFNCAAVPHSLAESELFGHEKGAFSGATQRHRGYFERAMGGTLLLDEITEMDFDLQAKLLRVLETQTLRRLGSETDIALDVRVISTSNRDPEAAIEDGALREDLYYRLAQFPLRVPSLRHRGADLAGLARYFLRELNEKHDTNLALTDGALQQIADYDWPGNVRELKHLVERAYIMSETTIDEELIQAVTSQHHAPAVDENTVSVPVGTSIADMERELIEATLAHTGGDKSAAASMLGISAKTLYNRLKEYSNEP